MAKLKGPLLSIDAFGQIGKTFAVSHWKGIKKAIKHFTPQNPRTILQQDNRSILRYAVHSWQSLTDNQKGSYDQSAKNLGLKMSGYNYYLQTYINAYAVPPPLPGIVTDGLVGWWKCDENTGIYTYDNIANMKGTLYNTPTWVTGKSNYALLYDGTNQYVEVPNAELVDWLKQDKSAFTIELWIYMNEIDRHNLGTFAIFPASEIVFGVDDESPYFNKLRSYASGTSGGWHWTDDFIFQAGQWYHITLTYDGSQRKHYQNAQLEASPLSETGNTTGGGANTYIKFGEYGAHHLKGIADEIRIYNRALSQAEIQQNYNVDA